MRFIKNLVFSLVESFIRNIGGGLGQRIRYQYYSRVFKSCGLNVRIDIGVIFENPSNIELGNDVWIMSYAQVCAPFSISKINIKNRIVSYYDNKSYAYGDVAVLKIGNEIQIGAYNIIHGYGGLVIEDRVTLSARVSLYSQSHYYRNDDCPSEVTYANSMVKSDQIAVAVSSIVLEKGVWLGLGVSMFGGTSGENSVVTAHSVVIKSIPENSYASGNPARRLKPRFEV